MLKWFKRDKKKKTEPEEPVNTPIPLPQETLEIPELDELDDQDLDFIFEDEFGRILAPEDDEAFLSEAEELWEGPSVLFKTDESFRMPKPVVVPEPSAPVEKEVPPAAEAPIPEATVPTPEPVPTPKPVPKPEPIPTPAPVLGEAPEPAPVEELPTEIPEPAEPQAPPVVEPEVPVEGEPFRPEAEAVVSEEIEAPPVEEPVEEEEPENKRKSLFARFKERLANTRAVLTTRVDHLLLGVKEIDEDVIDELEEILILADLGVKTTTRILQTISGQVARNELSSTDKLKETLRDEMRRMLEIPSPEFNSHAGPHVIMVVGVNGVGKTTTIAKLAHRFQKEGRQVMMVAGDTFRAAAVEQLTIWSERVGADIVKQQTGADPSAVVFDALKAAQARNTDVVIIDTAGRLHTKVNLMEELKKIKRVADKSMPGSPHEVLLVLDATTGQNAVNQASLFHEAVGVDRLAMTKLDGTAKGGVVVAIYNELKLPIRYVGLGEKMEDLRDFDPDAFVDALFG